MGRRTDNVFRKPPQTIRQFYEEVAGYVQMAIDAFEQVETIVYRLFDSVKVQRLFSDYSDYQKDRADISDYLRIMQSALHDVQALIC